MRQEFYQKVEGRTYDAPQYGHEIRVQVGKDIDEKGVVAMSKEAMEELGIQEGELVEILGAWMQEAEAVASSENNIALVRMDRGVREAVPCAVGQHVGIRKKSGQ